MGAPWVTKLFGGLLSKADTIIDEVVTSKEDKLTLKNAMQKMLLDSEAVVQENVTERWKADMNSDSWLSKNTRPLALIFLTIATTLMIIVDSTGLNFEVKHSWVMLLETLLVTVYVAYFGSRGAEKFKSISKK